MKKQKKLLNRYKEIDLHEKVYFTKYLDDIHECLLHSTRIFSRPAITHVCLHGNNDTKTNRVVKKIKNKFPEAIIILKQEKIHNKSIHFHLVIIYEHTNIHPSSILKRLYSLVMVDRSKKKQLVSYDVMDSNKCKTYTNHKELNYNKYDVWFNSEEERMKYSGKGKTYVIISKEKFNKIYCWISYLAKEDTSYNTRSLLKYYP
jgi:hypothetical protein